MDFIPGIDGPSEGVPRVLACFSNNLLRREPLKLVDGGQSQRTFVYIKDAIEAVLLMIENPARANGHIFNVGNPNNEVTVRQLAEMMTQVYSKVSLILRGANDYMLDEMERALHDSLCIIKRTLESNTVVAGGGAVEAALSVYLEYLATTLGSREQLAIAEFAESLLIIPKILAVNAAKDATELVAKLRAYHHIAQTKPDKKHLSSMGLDLLKGTVRNNLEAGVIEPAMSKVKIIQFATEAAITILRIDDVGDIIFE